MAYRDILVQVDDAPGAARRCEQAARLAHSLDAQLTGVFLRAVFPAPGLAYGGAWAPSALVGSEVEAFEAAMTKAAKQSRAIFDAAAEAAGARSEWRVLDQELAEALIDWARRRDLVVIPCRRMPLLGEFHVSPAEMALACGGPVLVLPDEAPQTPIGRRILIAWKGVREAARALRDAWPLIERADEVAVVMVGDVAADEVEQIRGRFARHGRNVEVFVEKEQDARAPEALRARVEAWKADLLVMGLYGRPRLAELVLGGVSREMIARAPCNLFVSH